jgi:hypothetical protein
MRTGPFSSLEVINRLNAFFVPVYVVNEDYRDDGPAPREERAELHRIRRAALEKKLSSGSVHVYVLDPKGEVIDSRHVAQAAHVKPMLAFLDGITAKLGTPKGKPLVAPRPQSAPVKAAPGSLVLHLVARGLSGGGSWPGTAEDWIVYAPDEVQQLLPADPQPGATSEPDAALVARLLKHVYPVTENNDTSKNEIKEQALRLTVLSVTGGMARARIDGRLVMRHDFYHKPDGKTVKTGLVGYVEWSPADGTVKALRLVTDGATYGGGTFAVAVRSVP